MIYISDNRIKPKVTFEVIFVTGKNATYILRCKTHITVTLVGDSATLRSIMEFLLIIPNRCRRLDLVSNVGTCVLSVRVGYDLAALATIMR